MIPINEVSEQFAAAIAATGMQPPPSFIADGKIHRFASSGRRGDTAGWYVLHLAGIPSGAFGDWRSGTKQRWRYDLGRRLTKQELLMLDRRRRAENEKLRRQREKEWAEARTRVAKLLSRSAPCSGHPYLAAKNIQAHGTRYVGSLLVIPAYGPDGGLRSAQLIRPSGKKLFFPGGRISGSFHVIGQPAGAICIAEGFATAASIHEATGIATVVAFHAGNLKAVAREVRRMYPSAKIILCADDDFLTPGNPGIKAAREAAEAVGGIVVHPNDRPGEE